MDANSISGTFLKECQARLEASLLRLQHCLSQLDEDQLWWKPNGKMNSVGILVKHIEGSFRQWTIIQMTGENDTRHRPDEFNDEKLNKTELQAGLDRLKHDFINATEKFHPERILDPRRIQGFDVNVMGALLRALVHVEGHVGQIMILTRIIKGENYTIFWTPQTDEQKAEQKTRASS